MIIAQLQVDGVVYSCHRFPEPRYTVDGVRQQLTGWAVAEGLERLGRIDVQVHSQRGLERLIAALWGRKPEPRPIAPPSREHDDAARGGT